MRILFLIPAFFCLLSGSDSKNSVTSLVVSEIKCNNLENPVGIAPVPYFSWLLTAVQRGQAQTAYQIIIGSDSGIISDGGNKFWDSGKIPSDHSAWIQYEGPGLSSGKEYFWKIRVWDESDKPSPWSKTGKFITALFDRKDWDKANWIGCEEIPDSLLLVPGVHGDGNDLGNIASKRTIVPLFRKDFSVKKKIRRAYAFVCGLGQYELYINGEKIGDRFLSPGWSDYRKSCLYNTFDVSASLKPGLNTLGAIVGNGFYNINRERYRKLVIAYGAPKMLLKLDIEYADGSKESIITDKSWKTSPSPITFTSIYGGEDYDARLEQGGWNLPGFKDESWKKVLMVKEPSGNLKPESDYPLKVSEIIDYKKISAKKDSVFMYDFGQNASGIIKIKISGKKGQEVRFIPGELLGEDSLVTQKATGEPYYFSYTLKGENEEVWIPKFSYYGFRYVEVKGAVPSLYPNQFNLPVIRDLKFLHTRNSSPENGSFKCSNELFNSIYKLIGWSVKSNLASVATDCPHREKLGWLEQTHLMGNSVKFIFDIHNLYNKMIDDMMEAQLENGLVPDIAPEFVPFYEGFRDSPEWGSACIIVPYDLYQWYGDKEAVRKAFPMMKKYLAYLGMKADSLILSHGLGDWYDLGPNSPGEAQLTPKALTATSMFFYDAKLLSEMAKLIGENEDAMFFSNLAKEIKIRFNDKFFNPVTKVYSTGSQTAYSMPLFFGMVDDKYKNDVIRNLIESIKSNNKALTAGDIGYRYLLRTLEEAGQSQLIFDMNSKTDVPGYGYQLSKGATSLTESWPALKYVSNNHMMLGHLMEWFYSGIGGIRQVPGSPSYNKVIISPDLVGDLTWAETTYKSVHGDITCNWKIENKNFLLNIKIPVNCTGIVSLPQTNANIIFENGIQLQKVKMIKILEVLPDRILLEIPSGGYNFSTHLN